MHPIVSYSALPVSVTLSCAPAGTIQAVTTHSGLSTKCSVTTTATSTISATVTRPGKSLTIIGTISAKPQHTASLVTGSAAPSLQSTTAGTISVEPHSTTSITNLITQPGTSATADARATTDDEDIFLVPNVWNTGGAISEKAKVSTTQAIPKGAYTKTTRLVTAEQMSAPIDTTLPFSGSDDMSDFQAPAKPILKTGFLKNSWFVLPDGSCFVDKVLPRPDVDLMQHDTFNVKYFIDLHYRAAAAGSRGQYTWSQGTPNYIRARLPLEHTTFNLESWRFHLTGYHSPEIIQFLEYGFPLGLGELPTLKPALANHGSAYQYYPWLDKFFSAGLLKGGVTGPCGTVPFSPPMVSPLMTASKKPSSRRAVFDATFGSHSLNSATPGEYYMGLKCCYTYPRVEDFQRLVLKSGKGCLIWKRDLSRYYLQIPLDPTEYKFTGAIWRGLYFFFTALMFGLRHSGLQGQRITDSVAWIHRNLGLDYVAPSGHATERPGVPTRHSALTPDLDPERQLPYNCVNYCDDLAGCETSSHKAEASFKAMGQLLTELGLVESPEKACAPATSMTYLGVHFDTVQMKMSVPPEKLQELRADLELWKRRTTAVRRDLQSILGKLFWVSKVVRHSRPFMGRLLQQLRDMKTTPDSKRVLLSLDCKKDILWWCTYLREYNGVTTIINDDDTQLSLELLMTSPYKVCAGDATLWGGGAWYGNKYWSREFPNFLKSSDIAVHVKEFWVVIASSWVWGDDWSGNCVYLFCDNDAVVDTIVHQKPRDPDMCSLLREFLYVVCLKKFSPILRKIDTKANALADHISRRYDHNSADQLFTSMGKPGMVRINVPDIRFKLTAPW